MTKEERLQKYIDEHPEWAALFFKNTVTDEWVPKSGYHKERATAMLEDYRNSHSLDEVAGHWAVSRERVRQILTYFYKEEYMALKVKNAEKRHNEHVIKEYTCKHCKNKFFSDRPKVYCSEAHKHDATRIIVYPDWVNGRSIVKKHFTEEEWREINRIRVNSYHHRHKEEMNRRQREWMKNNYERWKIYCIRSKERKAFGHALTALPNPKNIKAMKP